MQSETKTAYFAGLIDGEGYVAVKRRHRRSRQGYQLIPTICVGMTCRRTIDAIHRYFGGSTWETDHKPGYKPLFWWEVTCSDARRVAALIYPFSITKATSLKEIMDLPIALRGGAAIRAAREERPRIVTG